MTPKQIQKNIERLENQGMGVSRVVLLVEFKRGVQDREEILEAIARNRGESKASVAKMLKGWKPAILIRADSVGASLGDGDLGLTNGVSHEYGEIGYWRPEELSWRTAQVMDDNLEAVGEPDYETLSLQGQGSWGSRLLVQRNRRRHQRP